VPSLGCGTQVYIYKMNTLISQHIRKNIFESIVVLSIFLILTIIMLYPASLEIFEKPLGVPTDSLFFLWTLWWSDYSTFYLNSNPYDMTYLFYPNTTPVQFRDIPIYAGILTSPIQSTFGLVFSYNFIYFTSFVFGAYGAYLLCKYFTKNTYASFLGGMIFSFAPYHLFQAIGHMSETALQGIPFFILFLFYMKEKNRKYSFLFAGISLAFAAFLGGLYYLYFLVLFLVFFLIYHGITNKNEILNKQFITRLSLCFVVFVILGFPFVIQFTENISTKFVNPPHALGFYTADLANFIIPTPQNYFFTEITAEIYSGWTIPYQNEGTVFIGFSVLALVIISLVKFRKENRFWHIVALLAGVFSLGATLKIFGEQIHQFDYVMPGMLLQELPIATLRAIGRIDVITVLALSVISAVSLSYIFDKIKKNYLKIAIVLLFIFLIIIEYNIYPFPSFELQIPEFYETIRNEAPDYSILDIDPHHNYYQILSYAAIHQKPLVSGFVNRVPVGIMSDYINIPIVHQERILQEIEKTSTMKYLSYEGNQQNLDNFDVGNICAFELLDIRYIILHKPELYDKSYQELKKYLTELTGPNYFDDEKITVFRYDEQSKQCTDNYFGYLTTKGYDIFNPPHFPLWGTEEWDMTIYSRNESNIDTSLTMINFGEPTTLEVFHSGNKIMEHKISSELPTVINFQDLRLKEGKNSFLLKFVDGPRLSSFFPTNQEDSYIKDVLNTMWRERNDLRISFPEVSNGNYNNIIKWANSEGWKIDQRLSLLIPTGETPLYLQDDYVLISEDLLLEVWNERLDLQESFPEVADGDYDNLMNWAKKSTWYKDFAITAVSIPQDLLLEVWNERLDLQEAFPEVADGDYDNLMNWAKNSGWKKHQQFYPFIPKGEIPQYLKPRLIY